MFKKTIQFEDLDGNQVTEDFYFHLSKAELIQWELSVPGGLSAHLERALDQVKMGDASYISDFLEQLITRSIGERGADNRTFDKKKGEVARRFMQMDAYSVLFMEFGTNAAAAGDFFTALAPKDMQEEVRAEIAQKIASGELPATAAPAPQPEVLAAPAEIPAWEKEDRDPTQGEMRKMTPEEMQRAFAAKERRMRESSGLAGAKLATE